MTKDYLENAPRYSARRKRLRRKPAAGCVGRRVRVQVRYTCENGSEHAFYQIGCGAACAICGKIVAESPRGQVVVGTANTATMATLQGYHDRYNRLKTAITSNRRST